MCMFKVCAYVCPILSKGDQLRSFPVGQGAPASVPTKQQADFCVPLGESQLAASKATGANRTGRSQGANAYGIWEKNQRPPANGLTRPEGSGVAPRMINCNSLTLGRPPNRCGGRSVNFGMRHAEES
uniref:Uncharacterized protein n=1 Tax=Trichuris muris TaxID=70415 RepID=A0A5S6Q8X3_TRIMR